jgi:hypothetical protein
MRSWRVQDDGRAEAADDRVAQLGATAQAAAHVARSGGELFAAPVAGGDGDAADPAGAPGQGVERLAGFSVGHGRPPAGWTVATV